MKRMPAIFIGHGAPTLATDPFWRGHLLRELGQRLPKPEAVLVLSAHWESENPVVSSSEFPETIHDFYGFPEALYRIRYAAPGAPGVALRVVDALAESGIDCAMAPHGLDHGAWVPLGLLYPKPEIPVLQLSIQPQRGPNWHWEIGAALGKLREQGILIVGSGLLTHALREMQPGIPAGELLPWASEFVDYLAPAIESCDREKLLSYRTLAPNAVRAHPTDEHLLPLFSVMGAACPTAEIERVRLGFFYGSIWMDSYVFG